MAKLERVPHTARNRKTGRYKATPPCDGCGRPVGTNNFTDEEVCGGTDGPGFYLCERARCMKALEGLTVDQRRAHYEAQRNKQNS